MKSRNVKAENINHQKKNTINSREVGRARETHTAVENTKTQYNRQIKSARKSKAKGTQLVELVAATPKNKRLNMGPRRRANYDSPPQGKIKNHRQLNPNRGPLGSAGGIGARPEKGAQCAGRIGDPRELKEQPVSPLSPAKRHLEGMTGEPSP